MRICKKVMVSMVMLPALLECVASGQTVSGTPAGNKIIQTNGVFVGVNPLIAVNPSNITPNLGRSKATPAIGRPGITPAMPTPGKTAINPHSVGATNTPNTRFTTGIGQQTTGLGRQGSGTAIGQQGSGTAIGQQGGTAITPTNGVVIGQPQSLAAPTAPATGSPPSVIGFDPNKPNILGPENVTNSPPTTGRPNSRVRR